MDHSTNWPRVKALFQQALDQPDAARDAWLRHVAGDDAALIAEVASLLAAHGAPDRLAPGVAQLLAPLNDADDTVAQTGTVIGPYRLMSQLGAGGMGRVYLAERVDGQFTQEVALKLIRSELAEPELIQRFLRERETLSRLNHPNIAQLHDGGVTAAGAPYFTLEYVNGTPITDWCDARRLSIRERVRMMLKVCDAVEHAHRNLIVHRDIKPSNILVAQNGEPKLLDFGIAKPLQQSANDLTGAEIRPMTRDYAAPEQIVGEPVTTVTDVYTLGVLLYLLLSGRMPYREAALGRIAWAKGVLEEQPESLDKAVCRTASLSTDTFSAHESGTADIVTIASARGASPSALQRSLRGDLNRILQRAMAKAPTSRYPNVNALSADLGAYLDGRAIAGGTRTYRARKFLRKFWLPISAASTLLIVIIISAAIMLVDAQKIEREALTTTAVKEFLVDLFRSADPQKSDGKDITARDLVERGMDRITKMSNQPLLRGELESILGEINGDLEQAREASRLEELAIADLKNNGGSALLIATTESNYAKSLIKSDRQDDAKRMADDAIARMRKISPLPAAELAITLGLRTYISLSMHDFKTAAQFADESLDIARSPGVSKTVLAEALNAAAQGAGGKHDFARQQSLLRESLDVRRALGDGKDIHVAVAMGELAGAMTLDGGVQEELSLLTEATNIAAAAVGDKDPRLADIRGHYADALRIFGKFKLAHEELDLVDRYNTTISDPEGKLVTLSRRVTLLKAEGNYDLAMRRLDELTGLDLQLFGANSPFKEQFALDRCDILLGQDNVADAASHFAAIAPTSAHGHSMSGPRRVFVEAEIDRRTHRLSDARRVLEEGMSKEQFSHSNRTLETATYKTALGAVLGEMGETALGESTLRDAIKAFDGIAGNVVIPGSAAARLALAEQLAREPKSKEEAANLAKAAYDGDRSFYGPSDRRTQRAKALIDQLDKRA